MEQRTLREHSINGVSDYSIIESEKDLDNFVEMNDWCIIDDDNQAFENHTNNNTKNSNEMSDEKVKYVCENCYLDLKNTGLCIDIKKHVAVDTSKTKTGPCGGRPTILTLDLKWQVIEYWKSHSQISIDRRNNRHEVYIDH